MSKQREYYEEYWRRGGMIYGPQLEDKKAFIRENVGKGKRVLDIGCGEGYVSSVLVWVRNSGACDRRGEKEGNKSCSI
jgi:cyclopropane fatty-acyl-phospholipid synthase-like methyltransferase